MKSKGVLRIVLALLLVGLYFSVKILEKVFGGRIWIVLVVATALLGLWLHLRNGG